MGMVRLSPREEKNIQQLIARYGSLEKVPSSETAAVCYTIKKKDEFLEDENYFFAQVNELKPIEDLSNKRRKTFLGFNLGSRKAKS